jgi:AraC-like DNA-binding protein
MKFDYYTPCEKLTPFVQSLVISESDNENSYKVLPGTNLVIGFQYKGKLSYLSNGEEIALSNSGVTGLQDSYRIFKNTAGVGSVLVYFKVNGAAAFFSEPIHELFRQSLSLDNFILRSELAILEEQLDEAKSDIERIQVVERFLLSRLNQHKPDALVLAAIALIFERHGNIRMGEVAEKLHTSQSPLEKRFRRIVGATPKKFASIIRLKHTLQQFQSQTSLTSLAYESGFYDQAHFIKEFKNFTGDTPERFFSKE